MSVEALDAIKKSVVVDTSVERAWELFTARIADWWPLATHSLGGERTEAAVVTPDRIYERWADGSERTWGNMLVWDPPRRMVFTWEIGGDCGREVEVSFAAEGDRTRVDLEHRGWESGTPDSWRSYDGGWGMVLGRFEGAAA